MGWSLTIGTFAGTAVRLHFTFLLFLGWIAISMYLSQGPAAAIDWISFFILLFACVVLHEFGHIFMARRFGVKTPEVILSPIGGIANMERIPEAPTQELLIAIAGPLVNVVIAALLMIGFGISLESLRTLNFETATLAERLTLVNITLVVFNVIPAFPMDGGRMLRSVLAMNMPAAKATQVAARIGQAFAFLFVLLGLFYNPILMLVGIFIYFAAASEEQTAAFTSFAKGHTVKDAMEVAPVTLPRGAPVSKAVDALLAVAQRDFPVVDERGQAVGLLDRDAMLAGIKNLGADAPIDKLMRETSAFKSDMPLTEAFTQMRNQGRKAEVVVDRSGAVIGMLTLENVAEMMMVENARPGWHFAKKP